MKKFVLLLLTAFTVFTSASFAQPGTVCNANFSFTVTGNTVQFLPAGINTGPVLQHQWSFGDGTAANTANPLHVYPGPGIYVVNHAVSYRSLNDSTVIGCSDSVSNVITIAGLPGCNLHASFNAYIDSTLPNTVYFANFSAGLNNASIVKWRFGDGSTATIFNPTHTYQAPGIYNVCLSVKRDSLCADDTCMTVLVPAVNTCNLTAYFSSVADSSFGNTIHFYNYSTPLVSSDSIQWNFGDGSGSQAINPTHTYNQSGTYTVCLRVKKFTQPGTPPCVREHCQTIIVQAQQQCNLHANFRYEDSMQTGYIYFNNLSAGANPNSIVRWTFGDGTSSENNNPVHFYQNPGIYNVCLRISNDSNCVSDTCMQLQVLAPNSCNLTAYFAGIVDSSNTNTIHFINYSAPLASTDSIQWSFGDGSGSQSLSPSHTYSQAGSYIVCLRIKKQTQPGIPPCVREYCQTIIVYAPQQCNLHAKFGFIRDSAQTNTVYFINNSTGSTANTLVRWSFGDGTISTENNPAHTYQNSGVYTVCLYVGNDSLCASDTCKQVQVQVSNSCNLTTYFAGITDSSNTNTIHFINYSAPLASTDSIQWNFGDGSGSHDVNPTHTYNQAGTYTVCLRVKKFTQPGTAACLREYCKTFTVVPVQQCNLHANFIYGDSMQTGYVYFNNLSTGSNSNSIVRWTFGDGTASNDINPHHYYANPGNYTVCLHISNDSACVSDTCIQVQAANCNIAVNFVSHTDSINSSTIHFTNLSTALQSSDMIMWNFGDNNVSSDINPTHAYNFAGTYTVCLTVTRYTAPGTVPCQRIYCQTVTVAPQQQCNLHANFSIVRDSLQTNTVYFNNLSSGSNTATIVRWSFGDGTGSSDNNPVHTYQNTGVYTVCLYVGNDSLCSSDTCKTVQVQVANDCDLHPSFYPHADSSNNLRIYFFNSSNSQPSQATAQWTYGDGSGGNTWNGDHTYNQAGQYIVCLRVAINNTCIKDTCYTITVLPRQDSCHLSASFTSRIDGSNSRSAIFTNTSIAATTTTLATWTFGDGSIDTGWNSSHVYALPGRYAVCLRIVSAGNCTSIVCDTIVIAGDSTAPNCSHIIMDYVYRRDAYMPNKLFFFGNSRIPILHQSWTFTRLGNGSSVTVNQNNPMHIFSDTGYYRVCLRGSFRNGCVKEYCDTIRISNNNPAPQCMLQSFPNPAHNYISVNLQLQQPQMITASVYNLQNVLVKQKIQPGFAGNNLVTVNIQHLIPGYYIIRLVYGNRVCYTRFQKF